MNFKTAKMMTKYRVCMTFMSILLLLFHFVFLFSCGKLPEKTFAFSDLMCVNSYFCFQIFSNIFLPLQQSMFIQQNNTRIYRKLCLTLQP